MSGQTNFGFPDHLRTKVISPHLRLRGNEFSRRFGTNGEHGSACSEAASFDVVRGGGLSGTTKSGLQDASGQSKCPSHPLTNGCDLRRCFLTDRFRLRFPRKIPLPSTVQNCSLPSMAHSPLSRGGHAFFSYALAAFPFWGVQGLGREDDLCIETVAILGGETKQERAYSFIFFFLFGS